MGDQAANGGIAPLAPPLQSPTFYLLPSPSFPSQHFPIQLGNRKLVRIRLVNSRKSSTDNCNCNNNTHECESKTIKLINYCGMFSFSAGDNRFVAGERVKGLKCGFHPLNAGDLGVAEQPVCKRHIYM